MSDVRPQDILLRAGGRTLLRHGVLCWSGSNRADEFKETFSRADASICATYVDRDGIIRKAGAHVPRVEWVDLDGDGIRETPGILLEGSRINVVENGDYEADVVGTVGQNGGETIVRDTTQARSGIASCKCTTQNVGASGIWIRKRDLSRFAATAGSDYTFSLWVYAPAASVGKTFVLQIRWFDVTPAVLSTSVSGTKTLVAGWQRFDFKATAPGSTVTADLFFSTTTIEGVFDFYADLVQFEAGSFVSSAIPTGTAAVTRAADSLTVLLANAGPVDLTFGARVARPAYADAAGSIGVNCGVYTLGAGSKSTRLNLSLSGSRNTEAYLDDVTTDAAPSRAIPAGAVLNQVVRITNIATGGSVTLENAGGTASGGPASPGFAAWANQVLTIGASVQGGGSELFGVLIDLMLLRGGGVSLAEYLAVP